MSVLLWPGMQPWGRLGCSHTQRLVLRPPARPAELLNLGWWLLGSMRAGRPSVKIMDTFRSAASLDAVIPESPGQMARMFGE